MSDPVLDAIQEELTTMQKRVEELESARTWDNYDTECYDKIAKLEERVEKMEDLGQRVRVIEI